MNAVGIKRAVLAMLVLGLLQCAAYWWAMRADGATGVGCYDQNCYAQAARRIVEGHPFSYAPGQPATTGQTSVLYPFVLAAPMALGAEGHAIRTASLALSCVFFLVFVCGWGAVIGRLFPSGFARSAAIALVGLSGLCAYVAFTQCDQGLWMAVSALAAAAIACGSERWTVAVLTLAPWVRPEGMMLVFAFAAVRLFLRRRWLSMLLPLASVAAVFALNYALTGQAQFSSIANKGYLRMFPFAEAARSIARDGFSIVAAYLCSIPVPMDRLFTLPSPIASLAFWTGFVVLMRRPREWNPSVVVFFLAAALGVGSTASGGFAGLDFDRYLAWAMPVVFLTAAFGVGWVADRIRWPLVRKLPIVLVVITTLVSTVTMALMMRQTASKRAKYYDEVHEEAKLLPPDASVGSDAFVWAYELPASARFVETSGIFSPAFNYRICSDTVGWEVLEHEPAKRFDYWVTCPMEQDENVHGDRVAFESRFGEPLRSGTGRKYVYRADWSAYDRATETVLSPLAASARLSIGYPPDERAAEFRPLSKRQAGYVRIPVTARRESDGRMIVDVGALVFDGHEFSLPVKSGQPARLVMRAIGRMQYSARSVGEQLFEFGDSAAVKISVDGREAVTFELPLKAKTVTEQVIEIPAEFFPSTRARFRVEGRFAILGYWLYQ